MTSRDLRWPEVTLKWRHLTGIHLEVAVEKRKLTYSVNLTSYITVACSIRQSRHKMTSSDLNSPEVTSIERKSPGSGCRRPKTCGFYGFDFLQGCSSQEAVTWQEMTSRHFRWPVVTRIRRHLTGSILEVSVEGQKLTYAVRLTSYKAVAHRRSQSRDRKSGYETSSDRKWLKSDVIWPKVTWKWL